jgi:acyl-CoA thioesterase YciA
LVRVGHTSMSFHVSAWRRARTGEAITKVTDAMFTFVALDSEGRPRPIPD